jgi:excisionase family DNA binding protein
VTTGQAAALLGCHEDTVRRWCVSGSIRANRSGGRWLVRRAELERVLGVPLPANDNDTTAADAA